MLRVVDNEGRFLRGEERSVLHRSPRLVHCSVSVMVFSGAGDLFNQRRSDSKQVDPGKWDTSCSGHCAVDEDFLAAAKRELDEELGVGVDRLQPFWRRITRTWQQAELVQTYVAWHDGPLHLEPAEISDGRFWTPDEIMGRLGDDVFTTHLEEECFRWFLGRRWPRALAIDLDGTALDPEGRLDAATRDAVQAAAGRGIRVFLATARPPRSARPFVEMLKLDEPVIYYNGALVARTHTHEVMRHHPIEPGAAAELVRALRLEDPEVVISLEVLDRWFTDRPPSGYATETTKHFQPDAMGDLQSFLGRPVTKLLASWPRGGVHRLAEIVGDRFAGRLTGLVTDGGMLLQVLRCGVGKETALAELLKDAAIPTRDLLAIGDDMNDAGMLRMAGRAVAMANAPEALQRIADDVTGSNAELGVAGTIRKYILSVPEAAPAGMNHMKGPS